MLFYHSVSYNFFANFFGLQRGLNLRSLGEMQGLRPLRHEVTAIDASALRKRHCLNCWGTMYSSINSFSEITGSRTRDATVAVATPMTTVHRV